MEDRWGCGMVVQGSSLGGRGEAPGTDPRCAVAPVCFYSDNNSINRRGQPSFVSVPEDSRRN